MIELERAFMITNLCVNIYNCVANNINTKHIFRAYYYICVSKFNENISLFNLKYILKDKCNLPLAENITDDTRYIFIKLLNISKKIKVSCV